MNKQIIVQSLSVDPEWSLFNMSIDGSIIVVLRIGGVDHWLPAATVQGIRDTLSKMLGEVP